LWWFPARQMLSIVGLKHAHVLRDRHLTSKRLGRAVVAAISVPRRARCSEAGALVFHQHEFLDVVELRVVLFVVAGCANGRQHDPADR